MSTHAVDKPKYSMYVWKGMNHVLLLFDCFDQRNRRTGCFLYCQPIDTFHADSVRSPA